MEEYGNRTRTMVTHLLSVALIVLFESLITSLVLVDLCSARATILQSI